MQRGSREEGVRAVAAWGKWRGGRGDWQVYTWAVCDFAVTGGSHSALPSQTPPRLPPPSACKVMGCADVAQERVHRDCMHLYSARCSLCEGEAQRLAHGARGARDHGHASLEVEQVTQVREDLRWWWWWWRWAKS